MNNGIYHEVWAAYHETRVGKFTLKMLKASKRWQQTLLMFSSTLLVFTGFISVHASSNANTVLFTIYLALVYIISAFTLNIVLDQLIKESEYQSTKLFAEENYHRSARYVEFTKELNRRDVRLSIEQANRYIAMLNEEKTSIEQRSARRHRTFSLLLSLVTIVVTIVVGVIGGFISPVNSGNYTIILLSIVILAFIALAICFIVWLIVSLRRPKEERLLELIIYLRKYIDDNSKA